MLDRIKEIKEGNKEERNQLIQDYTPFIIKTVSNVLSRYIETENCEEYIIGLEAFNESIDKYDESRGNFLNFTSIVIKNKIIDYNRKEKSNRKVLYLEQFEECQLTGASNNNDYNKFNDDLSMQMEIMDFKNKLWEFKITLNDLVKDSPKHEDTRDNAIRIAMLIQESTGIKEKLYKNKKLPYSQISSDYCYSRKFLDKNKKFIIAAILILDSNLDLLKSYIYDAGRRASHDI